MKYLIVVLFVSSCAVFDGAKTLLQGTYEAGKIRGKNEILRDLDQNKKKLEPMRLVILEHLHDENYQDLTAEWKTIVAILGPLLIERNRLKNELEVANQTASDGKKD